MTAGFAFWASGAPAPPPPPSRPLDPYAANLWSCGGIVQYLIAYAGPLIRVQRASDSAELDIGFTGTGALDTTSLATFAAGTDAFVVVAYDQSGLGNNFVPGAGQQGPRIVLAGLVDSSMVYNTTGTATTLVTTNQIPGASAPGMSFATKYLFRSHTAGDPIMFTGNLSTVGHTSMAWQYDASVSQNVTYIVQDNGFGAGTYTLYRTNPSSLGVISSQMVAIASAAGANPILDCSKDGLTSFAALITGNCASAFTAENLLIGCEKAVAPAQTPAMNLYGWAVYTSAVTQAEANSITAVL